MLALHVPLHGPLPCEDAMRLWSEILQVEDTLFRKIFNHYRPELHYMRGPGPKWLEKHSAVANCAMPQESGSGGRTQACRPRSTFSRSKISLRHCGGEGDLIVANKSEER